MAEETIKALEAELQLVQDAINPEQASKELRDYMDGNSKDDHLAGTADGVNPWLQAAPSSAGCCIVS